MKRPKFSAARILVLEASVMTLMRPALTILYDTSIMNSSSNAKITQLNPSRKAKEAAFNRTYERFVDSVYSCGMTYLQCPHLAQEMTQDVFLKLWNEWGNFNSESHIKNWLFTVARNAAVDQSRKRSKDRAFQAELHRWLPSPNTGNHETLQFSEMRDYLRRAISHLPKKRQEIYRLSRHRGMTHQEIARRLGISVHTVRNQIVAASNSVRKYLRSRGMVG